MAAYAALVSLMNLLYDIKHHHSPPISLDTELVESITQHITFLLEFLHAYNPLLDGDDEEATVDPLEMRIAKAAYAAEDAIEPHIVETIQQKQQQQRSNDVVPENQNDENIRSIKLCRGSLQRVIEEMDSIKIVVAGKIDTKDNNKKKVAPVVHDLVAMTRVLASVSLKEITVGLDVISLQILEKLAGGQLDCQVIPIVGMGGIGKTFLARSIYMRSFIKEHFDICAWATISQQYNVKQILCEILFQAAKLNKERLSGENEDALGLKLHKYLFGRRFLVVIDDIWSIDAWDKIQRFFPNNQNGSRILVTTRLSQLSSQLNNDYSLHMSFLDEASSWDLFSKTVFGDNISCPHELKEIGEKIVKHCRGLPLSIAVVGGILKKMDGKRASWVSVRNNLASVVNMDNNKHCLRLLKMSYNHLPVYLKPCFLYMGVFKEDDNIRVTTLVRLWVSEGFLKPSKDEALETTAKFFLQDLVDRNLILVHELGSTGRIWSCKIHDLLRDLCLKQGQNEGLYHVIGQRNPPLHGMKRRVIIPQGTSAEKVCNELRYRSHSRSIIPEDCTDTTVLPLGNMRLLRILHDYQDESNLKSLAPASFNLRHLDITAINMSLFQLTSVVRNTWNLHTLIVCYFGEDNPIFISDFWKMPQFRCIEIEDHTFHLPDLPKDGLVMENLHTLKGVSNFKCCEEVVKRIPNIKRLALHYENDEDDDYFVGNIKSLCKLESLSVESRNRYVYNKLTFPHSLRKLSLCIEFSFEWEDMLEKIALLPFLEDLKLLAGCFGNGVWETVEGQFSCLKYLKLHGCRGLKKWKVAEEGSNILPRLEHLQLIGLYELEEIPCELGNIDTLKSIELDGCGEGAVKCAREIVDEQVESQGEEQLSFHVVAYARPKDKHLASLGGPNFEVRHCNPAVVEQWEQLPKINLKLSHFED